jgi:hypothetical protein
MPEQVPSGFSWGPGLMDLTFFHLEQEDSSAMCVGTHHLQEGEGAKTQPVPTEVWLWNSGSREEWTVFQASVLCHPGSDTNLQVPFLTQSSDRCGNSHCCPLWRHF